ncbi:dihydrolipoyl dehydrogenase [Tetragenococcus koreensis]|uniref:dihydrolipoyl dehydrogenase n=1 Tax=Tetragenococcus koreensis TaxID=290335 RepID=UPI001F37B0D6|nr:dihydrolipoyl dehydrogenase [Tetragenococcus koreensis]MDN6726156.1 dihydrolipoyl dehydrogenase [Tetragenococcus halophilus]MCF1586147.1 dihydrolipoyl dehydrogenase [Tetragenococcus koreensis]MCF1615728.1 dihydrolipoyl dehydrogenase [Tetragenococcus koreensis]MCF1620679.1 dihydrolipoyl dehydrogenase [Tetragenococcus koreensis]MCF1625524.1 dihydrolipoyl dehydrogenase [Tetragenococcus koreensis]
MADYDLVVIGSGPGGYVSAIKAAQKRKKTAVIEAKNIGGACLNVGCIPSKSYLTHAQWLLSAEQANQYGLQVNKETLDFAKMVQRKDQVVQTLRGGIEHLFQKYKIDYIEGTASFDQKQQLFVNGEKISYTNVLLACGSHPFVPPINEVDKVDFLTTDTFFNLEELPKELTVIGGGIVAIELAFAMKPLGVKVNLIEVAPDILLTEDSTARQTMKKKLQQMKIDVTTQAKIEKVEKDAVVLSDGTKKYFEQLLIATGRQANLEVPQQLGLKLDEAGHFVKVDQHYQTSKKGIYAIGDMIGGFQLAHAASAEGLRAVEAICGGATYPVDQNTIPRCLYTDPEVASFGLSEEEAKENYDVTVKSFPFAGNGKALASVETEGFVKIISEQKYQQILGAVVVGSHATEMIHTILAVKESEGTVDELAQTIFAHPTLSEVIGEDANSIIDQAIHG